LIRFALIRLRSDEHWLVYSGHGLLFDGPSLNIFFSELGGIYQARSYASGIHALPTPAPQYRDYAIWQNDVFRLDGEPYRELVAWWTADILSASYPDRPSYRNALLWCMRVLRPRSRIVKQVIGLALRTILMPPPPPRCELPFVRQAPAMDVDPGEGVVDWGMPAEVSARLRGLAREEHASNYVTRFAAYVATLAAESGHPDVVVYASLSNRARPVTQGVFGCCSSPAMLVLRLDVNSTFRQLLGMVRDRLRAMQRHADLPYHRVRSEMRAWKIKMPIGGAILSRAWTHPDIRAGDVEIACLPDRFVTAPPFVFDTKLNMDDESGGCAVHFDARYYHPDGVRGFVRRFEALLDAVAGSPDTRLRDVFDLIGARR
jgi:hypothetical protein